MERPTYKPVTGVTKFLWWCAGADAYFLQKSPMQDRVKYAGIGGIVFCTGLLACFSGFFACFTVFGPKTNALEVQDRISQAQAIAAQDESLFWAWTWAGLFGLVWGLMILNLDRFIVSSTGKGDGTDRVTGKELLQAFPRILIALVLGCAISAPLEIKILESEIDRELGLFQQKFEEDLNQKSEVLFKQRVAELELDKAEYEKKLKGYEAELKVYDDAIDGLVARQQAEMQDKRAYGFGPVAKKMQEDIETKRKEKDKFIALKQAEVGAWRKQLDYTDGKINESLEDLLDKREANKLAAEKYDGLLKRIQISHEIGGWIPGVILAVFLCIEMGPIFFKMMLNKGPYDYMVENHNKLQQLEAGVISESLLYESVNGVLHMDKYRYLEYETAKAEREEKMAAQQELNKGIIEEWKRKTAQEIRANPSKFIRDDSQA